MLNIAPDWYKFDLPGDICESYNVKLYLETVKSGFGKIYFV